MSNYNKAICSKNLQILQEELLSNEALQVGLDGVVLEVCKQSLSTQLQRELEYNVTSSEESQRADK